MTKLGRIGGSVMAKRQSQDYLMWKKSSASGTNGACVEVAQDQQTMFVRDSKNPQGSVLAFSTVEWKAFQKAIYDGGDHGLPDA